MRELPPAGASERERDFAINQLIRGAGNSAGRVTLTPGTTATVVANPNFNSAGSVLLTPMTAAAAAEVTSTYAVMAANGGSFVIHHLDNALTTRTFYYAVTGG